jgi:DNA-binding FrmR family transcriptional regulator
MNTYYKNDYGNFIPAEISSEDAIAILIQSAVTNAVNKVNTLIINEVISRVNDAVSDSNIQERVKDHLATTNIGELVDNAISNAVRDYDYDDTIESALDSVDIDEMVTEKVTDHLDSCSIQVRIN